MTVLHCILREKIPCKKKDTLHQPALNDAEGKVEIKRTINHKDSCIVTLGTYSEFEFKNMAILNKLRNVVFGNYIGKNMKEFIHNDTIIPYQRCYWKTKSPGLLNHLQLIYIKGLFINVYAEKLKYIKAYSENESWDWKLFLNEKITKIELGIE